MTPLDYAEIPTEKRNPRSHRLDQLNPLKVIELMNREDRRVLTAISGARHAIARAAERIAKALSGDGRLFFVGAGTSGRLGVLEAAECPPTFNTPPQKIQAIIAGGPSAVFRSKEGSEDSKSAAVSVIRKKVRRGDVVVGIAASGVTPFVRAALRTAKARGAHVILLTCNPDVREPVHQLIALSTGPEILAGSTRLKAGTACKMALNMLTLASMVRLGKVYENWMVDLQPKSLKLVARGQRLIERLGSVSKSDAARLYRQAKGHVKPAIVMAKRNVSFQKAVRLLADADGFLRKALK